VHDARPQTMPKRAPVVFAGLTFDMSGGRKQAKPACARPFDGRVSRRVFAGAQSYKVAHAWAFTRSTASCWNLDL